MNDTKPLLKLHGAVIVGRILYIGFPLGILRLYEDHLSFKIWPAWSYTIPFKDIEAIILAKRPHFLFFPFNFPLIEIQHRGHAPLHIEFVSFPPSRIKGLIRILRERGVQIDDGKVKLTDKLMRRNDVAFRAIWLFIIAPFLFIIIAPFLFIIIAMIIQLFVNLSS